MSSQFFLLRVKQIKKETADCVSIVLDIPTNLQQQFAFIQGQNVVIKTNINGQEIRRTYSICSSPLDNELRIAVKKVQDGIFSTYANTYLKVNDELHVMPPNGKFYTPLVASNKKHYVAFAAGSGITPILSIIKTTLLTEANSSFTLVYGNKNRNAIIFKEELEYLKNKFLNRFQLLHILSREKTDAAINFGRIDTEKCATLFNKAIHLSTVNDFFICGPQEMTFAVKEYLEQNNVNKANIHFELFAATKKLASTNTVINTNASNTPTSQITIKLDGRSFDFELPINGTNILDAALQQGADLPYACKGGVCCTCKAKVLQGNVQMEVCWGLEHEEVEQGYILTCQAHPTSNQVVIDFDVK